MPKPLGSHIERMLEQNLNKVISSIKIDFEEHDALKLKQQALESKLKNSLEVIEEVLELKGTDGKQTIEFVTDGIRYTYDLKNIESIKEKIASL